MAPKTKQLDIPMPEGWRMNNNEPSPFIELNDAAAFANVLWWEQFHDPVLNDLISEALENNKELAVAAWRVSEFAALFRFVYGNLYPQVTADGFYNRRYSSIAQNPLPPGASRYSNTYSLSLNGFFQIDVWGRLLNQSSAAFHEFLAQDDARRFVVITVMSSVASSYIQLRKYDKQLVIAKKTLDSRNKALELAKIRYDNGYTSELEVKQAESAVTGADAEITRLKILDAQEENLLSILIGRNPGPILRGRDIDDLYMPPRIPVGLPSSLLGQRPDILQAEQKLIGSDALIGAARAAFFPEISLTGMLGTISPVFSKLFTNDAATWNYGGSFFQTVFDGGRLSAQLDAAEAVKWQAFYNYEQVIQNAFREVNDSLIAHQLSQELLVIEKNRMKIFQEYLELARLQYTNGQVDYLNVLDAERNLFDSELKVVQAESDTFLSLINLYTALGGGWVVDYSNKSNESEPITECCLE